MQGGAVLASQPEFLGQGLTLAALVKLIPAPDAGFLVHEAAQGAPQKFFGVKAQHLGQTFIGKGEPGFIIQDEDPLPGGFHNGAVFFFRGLQLQFQMAAIGNVLTVFKGLDNVAARVFDGIGVHLEMPLTAVRQGEQHLPDPGFPGGEDLFDVAVFAEFMAVVEDFKTTTAQELFRGSLKGGGKSGIYLEDAVVPVIDDKGIGDAVKNAN